MDAAPIIFVRITHLAQTYTHWRRYAARKSASAYLCQLILQQTKTAKYIIGTDTQKHESRAAYLPAEKNKTESNNSNEV